MLLDDIAPPPPLVRTALEEEVRVVRQIVVDRCLDLAGKLKRPDYRNFDVKRCADFEKRGNNKHN